MPFHFGVPLWDERNKMCLWVSLFFGVGFCLGLGSLVGLVGWFVFPLLFNVALWKTEQALRWLVRDTCGSG